MEENCYWMMLYQRSYECATVNFPLDLLCCMKQSPHLDFHYFRLNRFAAPYMHLIHGHVPPAVPQLRSQLPQSQKKRYTSSLASILRTFWDCRCPHSYRRRTCGTCTPCKPGSACQRSRISRDFFCGDRKCCNRHKSCGRFSRTCTHVLWGYWKCKWSPAVLLSRPDNEDFVGTCLTQLGLSGTVGATTLNIEQLASHYHYSLSWVSSGGSKVFPWNGSDALDISANTGGSQSHAHSLSNVTSSNGNNLPLFYALSFIIRIS